MTAASSRHVEKLTIQSVVVIKLERIRLLRQNLAKTWFAVDAVGGEVDVKLRSFVEDLLHNPLGRIALCNLVLGYQEGLFDQIFAKQLFDWWVDLCTFTHSSTASAKLGALGHLTGGRIPPTFRPGVPRPVFRFAAKKARASWPGGDYDLVSVAHAIVLRDKMSRPDLRRLLSNGYRLPPVGTTQWSDADTNRFSSLESDQRWFRLAAGRRIGNDILWFTSWQELDKTIGSAGNMASNARDRLGLVHYLDRDTLVALFFSSAVVRHVAGGRPTFADAGVHRRFQARAKSRRLRSRSAWGRTADLALLKPGCNAADGVQERVSNSLDDSAIKSAKVPFSFLASVVGMRGDTSTDSDLVFSTYLQAFARPPMTTGMLFQEVEAIL